MFAVVQIGSKTLRSAWSTARTVRATGTCACARPKEGAETSAAAPSPVFRTVRRVVVIAVSLSSAAAARQTRSTFQKGTSSGMAIRPRRLARMAEGVTHCP